MKPGAPPKPPIPDVDLDPVDREIVRAALANLYEAFGDLHPAVQSVEDWELVGQAGLLMKALVPIVATLGVPETRAAECVAVLEWIADYEEDSPCPAH